jgi:hypothetical protein
MDILTFLGEDAGLQAM